MEGFYASAEAAKPPAPKLLLFNHALAGRLGIDVAGATDEQLARIFSGEETPEGADPLALAYAGPPFGPFSPQPGDRRALLHSDIVAPAGARITLQPQGSGHPGFSRLSRPQQARRPPL